MPIYEYVCKACGRESEIIHKISDPPERKCPHCGKNQLTKLISAAAFRLKGGGWYETDFKSDSDRKRNLVSDKEDAPAAKADDAKPAAKPAADTKKVKEPVAKAVKKPASLKKPTPKKRGK